MRVESRTSRFLAHAAALLYLLMAVACGGERAAQGPFFRGVALPAPIEKPQLTLTDFNGRPYDFAAETRDKVALLFFGYTHCPDVCPLHMANIAAVLKQMSAEDRARVVTVFVTTDPERDTPQRLKEWLGNFDPTFVGLTGTQDELARAQQSVATRPAEREYVNGDSVNYFVGHSAMVFAFARDGNAYTVYPFGVRQEDWANDLPRLVRYTSGADIQRDLAAQAKAGELNVAPEPAVASGTDALVVSTAVVAEPPSMDEAAAYFTIRNNSKEADTLVAVATDIAVSAEVHETMGEGEMRHMMAMPSLPVPAGAEVALSPNGDHVMLQKLKKKLVAGDTVSLFLSFSRSGSVNVRAPVVSYADLQRVLEQGAKTRR